MKTKITAALLMMMAFQQASAQKSLSAEQTITDWEAAINQHDLKKAYALTDAAAMGSYEKFEQRYGTITELTFMDMAAPGSTDKTDKVTIGAGGDFEDSKQGKGSCDVTFQLVKDKNSKEWSITKITWKSNNMTPPETAEVPAAATTRDGAEEPAADATTE